ncbi:DNA polymerase III subunit delta [Bacillota bacterium]
MAAYKEKNQEHAYKRIQRDIKSGDLKNLLFFYGEEEYLINWALDEIVNRYIDPGVGTLNRTSFNWKSTSVEELIEECETLPMFAEKRVVIIEGFKAGEEKSKEDQEPADTAEAEESAEEEVVDDKKQKDLIRYAEMLPDSCFLILTSQSADKRRKIYKTINSLGACYEFSRLDEPDVRSLIKKRLAKSGKTAEANVIRRIIEMSGYLDKQSNYKLYNLENDIKKLVAHSVGNEILITDLNETLSRNTEAYVFDMIDAISQNRKGDALSLLHSLINSGEVWQKLLALICSSYEVLLIVKEMKEDGFGLGEIFKKTGIHEYRIKIASGISGRYSSRQLRHILCSCFTADKNIKFGLLDEKLAIEMLIACI